MNLSTIARVKAVLELSQQTTDKDAIAGRRAQTPTGSPMLEEKNACSWQQNVQRLNDGTFYCRLEGNIAGKQIRFSGSATTLQEAGTKLAEWGNEAAGRLMGANLDEGEKKPTP